MVIHQFNKLIRNKWVWGVFAVAISAFFAFDFLVADLNRSEPASAGSSAAGTLNGEDLAKKAAELTATTAAAADTEDAPAEEGSSEESTSNEESN